MAERPKIDLGLTGYDELFMDDKERQEIRLPRIHDIPLDLIDDFPGHPYQVRMDEDMDQLVESIKERGIITPVTLRPKEDGRYEMVSGHRRKKACEIAGMTTIKADVRDMSRDDAIILMVESNLQRSVILPSEKAFSYKMRMEALKRQGQRTDLTSSPVGTKLERSSEMITAQTGDSRNQIHRYVRLTYLIPEILQMVDEGKIAFRPAVEISYLTQDEQKLLLEGMEYADATPSLAQAIKLKNLSNTGSLDYDAIEDMLSEEKPNQREKFSFRADRLRRYTRNSFVTQYYDDATTILFVDGMGIEYVDYLAHLFDELDEKHFQCSYDAGYCTLPSVTEINKDFMNGRNTAEPPIRDLDELKHSNNVHPESLIKQFGHLDSIKDRVLGLLNGNISKVIIAADHGTSRLAVKIRNTEYDNALPKPDGVSVYKYGRFCDDTVDETLYPTAISISDRLIFADYSRFIQPGAPIDEIHGGASLEEWIVPVIVIEKLGKKKKVTKVEITPKATKYKPELVTKLVRVQFAISGEKRDKVYATVRGQKILCEYKDGCYNFVFTAESSDNKLLIKVVDGGIIGQFEIEIEQGIKKNLKFDI